MQFAVPNGINSPRRPMGVWVISIIYVLSAGWTLLSFALVFGGSIRISPAQAYVASLGAGDLLFSLAIAFFSFSAAVSLWLLRKIAIALFSITLFLNVIFTLVQIARSNFSQALGDTGLLGLLLSWLLLIAVIVYARGLAKMKVLS
jgi:hypothetical protein